MKPKHLIIVKAVTEQGLTHAQAAEKYGITRQWVHTLVTRYQTEGTEGLTPRSKAPKTRPGRTPDHIRERIIELRTELTSNGADAGPATIAWHLRKAHLPTPRTIHHPTHPARRFTDHPSTQKTPQKFLPPL